MFFRKKKVKEIVSVEELPEIKPEFGYYINATSNGYGAYGAFLIYTSDLQKVCWYSDSKNKESMLAFILSKLNEQFGEVSVKSDMPNMTQELVSSKNEYIQLLRVICDFLCGYPLSISNKLLILKYSSIDGIPESLVKMCEYDIEGMGADY